MVVIQELKVFCEIEEVMEQAARGIVVGTEAHGRGRPLRAFGANPQLPAPKLAV